MAETPNTSGVPLEIPAKHTVFDRLPREYTESEIIGNIRAAIDDPACAFTDVYFWCNTLINSVVHDPEHPEDSLAQAQEKMDMCDSILKNRVQANGWKLEPMSQTYPRLAWYRGTMAFIDKDVTEEDRKLFLYEEEIYQVGCYVAYRWENEGEMPIVPMPFYRERFAFTATLDHMPEGEMLWDHESLGLEIPEIWKD